MTEVEWLSPGAHPTAMLEAIRDRASDRKLYLLSLVCTREFCKLKPDGVAAMAALEEAIEASDRVAAVRTLDAAHPRYGFNLAPWNMANGSAIGPSGYKGVKRSPALIREVFGNPFRPVAFDPAWRTTDVVLLASGIYDEKAFDRMPILADALQDAGCDSEAILSHCRDPNQVHVRGCWVVDLVLGKS
jgi:hypothetical protein